MYPNSNPKYYLTHDNNMPIASLKRSNCACWASWSAWTVALHLYLNLTMHYVYVAQP